MNVDTGVPPHRSRWDVVLWSLVGVGGALGVVSLLTIGPFVIAGTAVLAAVLAWRRGLSAGVLGCLVGAALVPLRVAWLNKDGPGQVCFVDPDGTACRDEFSPWPWVAVALVLVAAGLGGAALLRRTARLET